MHLLPFVFGMLGERLCPSKARGNFEKTINEKTQTKFPRVPCGQTFDRLRFALPFRVRRKAEKRTETISLPLGFFTVTLGNGLETLHSPCLFAPAVKAYAVSKKFRRNNHQ